MEPYILYDIRCARFLSLRNLEDVFSPQRHLLLFEIEEQGYLTAAKLATESEEVLLARTVAVNKVLRRLKVMFFKDFHHIFSNGALFMKSDKQLETWKSSRYSHCLKIVPEH